MGIVLDIFNLNNIFYSLLSYNDNDINLKVINGLNKFKIYKIIIFKVYKAKLDCNPNKFLMK